MNGAAEGTDDFARQIQAHSVMGRRFGGEERTKDLFSQFGRDPRAIVRDGNAVSVSSCLEANIDKGLRAAADGFDGIV